MRSFWLCLHSFHRSQDGAVAIIFALFLNVAIAICALNLDAGRAYLATAEMNNAATAASLSSAIENGDEQEALDYFAANLPKGLHSIDYSLSGDVQITATTETVSVFPRNFTVPAFFSPAITKGATTRLNVQSISEAGIPGALTQPADYFFVLDISGSMTANDSSCPSTGLSCTRIASVQDATLRVIDSIAAAPSAATNYKLSLTTWSDDVVDSYPLTSDFVFARAKADQFLSQTDNCTNGASGLRQAAQYLLSSAANNAKIVVFMTDGSMNTVDPAAPCGAFGTEAFDEVKDACDAIKAKGGSVWSITFGSDALDFPENKDLRDYCASAADQSIHAADGKALDVIFQLITSKTGKLKLVQ